MSVRELKAINVLNYNDNVVIVSTRDAGYSISHANNDSPSILPLTFDEIAFINSNSEVFRTGILRFQEDLEEEIYEELKITNWKDILTNKDIEEIILNPTIKGLKSIIKIQNTANFDRVKGIFTGLKNENVHDISMRVEKIIKARDAELRRGVRNTEIQIQAKDTKREVAYDEVNELKEQNSALQEQMLEMQNMIKEMMEAQGKDNKSVEVKEDKKATKVEVKEDKKATKTKDTEKEVKKTNAKTTKKTTTNKNKSNTKSDKK